MSPSEPSRSWQLSDSHDREDHPSALPFDSFDSIEVEDHRVILFPRLDRLLYLNPPAAALWELLESCVSLQEAADFAAPLMQRSRQQMLGELQDCIAAWNRLVQPPSPIAVADIAVASIASSDLAAHEDRGATCRYRHRGTTFQVDYGDSTLSQLIHPLIAGWSDNGGEPPVCTFRLQRAADRLRLYRDDTLICEVVTPEELKGALFTELASVDDPSRDWMAIFHAAAVARNDRAVILCGASGQGKSTLAAVCAASGLDYLGDDLVPVERETRHVHALPTRLSVKQGSWGVLAELYPGLLAQEVHARPDHPVRYLPLDQSPSGEGRATHRVQAMVFPVYRPAMPVTVTPLASAEALGRVLESRSWLGYPLHAERISQFLDWFDGIPRYEIRYGDALEAAATVAALLEE